MRWFDQLTDMEAFDGCVFDAHLVDLLQREAEGRQVAPLRVATPSFQAYATSEASQCCRSAFPVFSVTGSACALQCEHCRAKILEPMIPAESPDRLEQKVRAFAATRDLRGFLLSGGSNRRNEIAYDRYLPAVERLKRDLPGLQVAVHTGLVDDARAQAMAAVGIDVAMMDVIGDDATIRDVYHLDRRVEDFARSLAALTASGMRAVPHIVIGLHFGEVRGERRALDICAALPIDALVLVVVMPAFAAPDRFETPRLSDVAAILMQARRMLPDRAVTLGCARPHGLYRRSLDAYAVMAGLDAIAFPAEGAITLARRIGRPLEQTVSCCAMKAAGQPLSVATS